MNLTPSRRSFLSRLPLRTPLGTLDKSHFVDCSVARWCELGEVVNYEYTDRRTGDEIRVMCEAIILTELGRVTLDMPAELTR